MKTKVRFREKGFFVAAPGTTMPGIAELPIGTTITLIIGTTTLGFDYFSISSQVKLEGCLLPKSHYIFGMNIILKTVLLVSLILKAKPFCIIY